MPTIELASIGCTQPPDLPYYDSFTYSVETRLFSHRELFQPVFNDLNGVIVHLANKERESTQAGLWFAADLINWNGAHLDAEEDTKPLIFLPDALLDVRDLMRRLLTASPQKHITFSSDYQFGGEERENEEISFSRFFKLHASQELYFNHLWHVVPDT